MKRLLAALTLVAALSPALLAAPTPAGPAAPTPPGGSGAATGESPKFHLLDGSVLTGRLTIKELTMETQYGTLRIPVADIVSFTPGLDSHPEFQTRLDSLIEKLGATEFSEREAAQRELAKMADSVRPELVKHLKDNDAERRTRIQAILDQVDDAADSDDSTDRSTPWQRKDTIQTREFTVTGKINPRQFEVASNYGSLTLKLSDIRSMQCAVVVKQEIRKTFEITAINLAPSSLKDTGIRLEKGDMVTMTADGQLMLSPWNRVTGPDGSPNTGNWFVPGLIPMGALVGRVGEGSVFKVGAKNSFRADRTGTLSLGVGIGPDYSGTSFPGTYKVKVTVKSANSGAADTSTTAPASSAVTPGNGALGNVQVEVQGEMILREGIRPN